MDIESGDIVSSAPEVRLLKIDRKNEQPEEHKMGKRNKQYEEEQQIVECRVCDGTIPLEFYVARGDMIYCDECGAEYIIKSRNPVRLFLLEEEFDEEDDVYDMFNEDDDLYDGRGYD